jgi:hypothetical protein
MNEEQLETTGPNDGEPGSSPEGSPGWRNGTLVVTDEHGRELFKQVLKNCNLKRITSKLEYGCYYLCIPLTTTDEPAEAITGQIP